MITAYVGVNLRTANRLVHLLLQLFPLTRTEIVKRATLREEVGYTVEFKPSKSDDREIIRMACKAAMLFPQVV